MKWKEALEKLKEGNERFVSGKYESPRRDEKRRLEVMAKQTPLAAILCCADSRVTPEFIFDQGIGDLFVVRNAGNIASPEIISSLELAVAHMGIKFIVVLGHENCGAVNAVINEEKLQYMIDIEKDIKPVITKAKNQSGDLVENSIKLNAQVVQEKLQQKLNDYDIKIVSAYYSFKNGSVEYL